MGIEQGVSRRNVLLAGGVGIAGRGDWPDTAWGRRSCPRPGTAGCGRARAVAGGRETRNRLRVVHRHLADRGRRHRANHRPRATPAPRAPCRAALHRGRPAVVAHPPDTSLRPRLHPPRPHLPFAEKHHQLVYGGPGLVWDDGFGDGWTDDDLWNISEKRARHLLYGTLRAVMQRYRVAPPCGPSSTRPSSTAPTRATTGCARTSRGSTPSGRSTSPMRSRGAPGRPARDAAAQRLRLRDRQPVRRPAHRQDAGDAEGHRPPAEGPRPARRVRHAGPPAGRPVPRAVPRPPVPAASSASWATADSRC